MKVRAWVGGVVLLAASMLLGQARPRRLVVASNIDNRPFEYVDAKGQPAGFTNDLFRALAKAQGFEVDIRPMPFKDMMAAFERKEVDALTSVVYTSERAKVMDFTAPHSYVTYVILTRKGDGRIRSEEDLRGKKLLVLARSFLADHFTAKGFDQRAMPTYEATIQALSEGDGDCTVVPKFTWLAYAKGKGIHNLQVVPGELYPAKRCIAVHPGDRELLAQLNEGLFQLKQNGQMDEIYGRHLGWLEEGEVPLGIVFRKAMRSLGPPLLGLGFLGVLAWSVSLRRMVRQRTRELQEELATRKAVERERERLFQEVERANADLGAKNLALERLIEDKDQFMGIAAHDIRNPLNAVYLSAQQIEGWDGDRESVEHHARMVQKAVRQMMEIVSSLLDLNQLESGQLKLQMRMTDLGALAEDVVASFEPIAKAKGLGLILERPEGPALAWVDPHLVRNVMDNLISNALKFMPPGPPERRALLRVQEGAGTLDLVVKDEGPGFSEEDQRKVFGRFARLSARPTSGEGSTGLGLSIVKRWVEAMGGAIRLESELGRGATFTLRFSSAAPPASSAFESSAVPQA